MKRKLSLLLAVVMILSLVPMSVFATSNNSVNKVLGVPDDHKFQGDVVLTIAEDSNKVNHFKANDTFEVVLPEGAEWIKTGSAYAGATVADHVYGNTSLTRPQISIRSSRVMEVELQGNIDSAQEFVNIPLHIQLDGAAGELALEIRGLDSAVSSGNVTFAKVGNGTTTATIDTVKKFARENTIGTIRIAENAIGSISSTSNQKVTMKLPPKFTWEDSGSVQVTFSGGLGGMSTLTNTNMTGFGGRTLEITIPATGNTTSRGMMYISGLNVRADRDAKHGEVVVDLDGTKVSAGELKVAEYAQYGVEVKVKEVKEVVSGRKGSDNKTALITIEEVLAGSLIKGREVEVELPDWVKVEKVTDLAVAGNVTTGDIKSQAVTGTASPTAEQQDNVFYFVVNDASTSTKNKYEFKMELSVKANKEGDIEAIVKGAGVDEQTVVVAKAIKPVTAEFKQTDVKIGVQNQAAGDVIIKETKKGMLSDDKTMVNGTPQNQLKVALDEGFDFYTTPKVEVLEGNGELDTKGIKVSGTELIIPIKSSSTKPMTIKVSGIAVTLDRTIPEGPAGVYVKGSAIVKNYDANDTNPNFKTSSVVAEDYVNVVTPAPGEVRATSKFVIGKTTYTVIENGKETERTMDVAPFINANGRTMLPVSHVARALGVAESGIIWNEATRTVTIFKGDRVAQMTIDSNVLTVNGTTITMDTNAAIVNGRTVLPVHWAAQALGAQITWDAATQTVTVNQ